jgi:hypothetical protein
MTILFQPHDADSHLDLPTPRPKQLDQLAAVRVNVVEICAISAGTHPRKKTFSVVL